MAVEKDYIKAFLRSPGIEGPQQVRGYIPCFIKGQTATANYRGGPEPERYQAMGASGVTIGTGVDLGQTDAATLTARGLDARILEQVRPHLQRKRDAAILALHQRPLEMSQPDVEALDNALLSEHFSIIPARYNRDNPVNKFESLPAPVQAAIFSLLYQCGTTGGPNRAPKTWEAFLRSDWTDAASRLKNRALWKEYQNRRMIEGRELAKAIKPRGE